MSGGEQQMLAIGRALMATRVYCCLMSHRSVLRRLSSADFRHHRAAARAGDDHLPRQQNANQALKLADRGYVLENGM